MFLHKISTRVVCVNGKQPYDILESFAGEPLSFLRSKVTRRDYGTNGRNIVGASIKPGTWNIPEHSGTSRNMKKLKYFFMKK